MFSLAKSSEVEDLDITANNDRNLSLLSNKQESTNKSISNDENERTEKIKAVIQNYEETMLTMSKIILRHYDQENAPFTNEFRQCILKLAKSYYHFKLGEIPHHFISDYRKEMGKSFIKHGIVKIMCDILSESLKRQDFMEESGDMVKEYWFPVKNILLTLLNFSDSEEMIRVSVTEHPEALSLLLKTLEGWQGKHLSLELSEDQNKLVRWSLSLIHNCAGTDENVPRLRELGTIQIVLPYLDSTTDSMRMSTISILALLVNEEESELLRTHVSIFQFMIQRLANTLNREDHKDLGWSADELTIALGKLARNDANKKLLVEEGCLPVLVELLKIGYVKEKKEAINCLWALSFEKDNKGRMISEPQLVQTVYDIYKADTSLRHGCHGILWSLRDELLTSNEFKSIGEQITGVESQVPPAAPPPPPASSAINSDRKRSRTPSKSASSKAELENKSPPTPALFGISLGNQLPSTPKEKGHVMISYQWAHQETILQICANLRSHGVPVWIDVDNMEGSTLQAMAKAVEDSLAVIVAMSQKYKDSPNTRAEAEYAFQKRKKIIPLIMQRNYNPDGWLGLILGAKLFYDFSGKYSFESRMNALLGAVNAVRRGVDDDLDGGCHEEIIYPSVADSLEVTKPPLVNPSLKPVSKTGVTHLDETSILSWTEKEIAQWLMKHDLQNSPLLQLCGEEILFLHKIKSEAPEYFYYCLESKLHLTSLLELSRAAQALTDLTF